MLTSARTIRVFISSPFSDLKAERNALQERVFPRLKRYCQRRGWSFQAIDLRWGISHEAALDQSTMRICRAEIARCQAVTPRPNFVVLLGDRHGWRPLPDEIPAVEFEALLPHLPAALANRWYRLDENAVCPLPDGAGLDKGRYILQPRTDEFNDYDKWFKKVEEPLGEAFREAARKLNLPEDARLKYEASATAQEIYDGAFAVPDAREHVVAFIREIRTADGRPLREALPDDAGLNDFVDLTQGELDHESQAQLDALKQKLRDHLGEERVKTYTTRWEGNGASTEHVQRLSLDVLRSLGRLIHAQIKQHSAMPPLEEERLRHQEFAQRRARDFTGQAGPLGEIERYLSPTSEPVTPLVVHGASGSGKSALLAKAVQNVTSGEWRVASGKPKVIFRFIGATANSTDPRSLLEALCRELGELYGADNTDLPLDLNKLTVVFRQRLALATAEHPLTLFLDALDQLQVSGRPELSWLPDKLPAHVRFVLSLVDSKPRSSRVNEAQSSAECGIRNAERKSEPPHVGCYGDALTILRKRLPAESFLELLPMEVADAEKLFKRWLDNAKRRLIPEKHWKAVRDGFTRCSLPLYLRLAFEEAQRWRSYDNPPPPSPDVDGLIERLFTRLSEPANHGPLLVERAVSYLRCSRHGLSEDETLDLLANDPEYWEHFRQSAHHALPVTDGQQTRRLPVVLWSRLYHDLEPYLSWRSADGTALMVFFHTRFNEVAERQFLRDDFIRRARHNSLATYFRDQADPGRDGKWDSTAARPFLELPGHLHNAGCDTELRSLLLNFRWLQAKLDATSVVALIADYDHLPGDEELGLLQGTLRLSSHSIGPDKSQLAGQFVGRLSGETTSQLQQLVASACAWRGAPWLRPLNGNLHRPGTALIRTLQGHSGRVNAVALTADGRRVVSGADDRNLKVCDVESGMELRALEGHTGRINAVALRADGRLAVSGSSDHTLRVWALESGRELWTLKGHSDEILAVAMSADGRLAVSGSSDHTLRVWNLDTGCELRTLRGHQGAVLSVALSADGRLALSGSSDPLCFSEGYAEVLSDSDVERFIKVWDVESGRELGTLKGHAGDVTALALTEDGSRAVSGAISVSSVMATQGDCMTPRSRSRARIFGDCRLAVWDVKSGRELRTCHDHAGDVTCVAASADGRRAVWGTNNGNTLQVWDVDPGRKVRTLRGHADLVLAVALCRDGRFAVSGSADHTVKIWDLEHREQSWIVRGHDVAVVAVALSEESQLAVSESEDGLVNVWNLQSGSLLRTVKDPTRPAYPVDTVGEVAFSTDGRRAISEASSHIVVWDLVRGQELRTLVIQRIRCLAINENGRMAVVGSSDHMLTVWDLENGRKLRTLQGHSGDVSAVSMSADGLQAISGGGDHTVRIWDLKSGVELETLQGQAGRIVALAVSANGRRAVSGDDNQMIKIWDLEHLREQWTCHGHTGQVLAVAVDANGKRALSGAHDHTLKMWDLESGQCLASFTAEGAINGCVLTSDGRTVVAGEASGRIHFLRLLLPDDPLE